MAKIPGLLAGPKIGGGHSTYIDEAVLVVFTAKNDPAVKKVIIGVIKSTGKNAPPRLKCSPLPGGLMVQVRGVNAVQKVVVYTEDPEGTSKGLQRAWDKEY